MENKLITCEAYHIEDNKNNYDTNQIEKKSYNTTCGSTGISYKKPHRGNNNKSLHKFKKNNENLIEKNHSDSIGMTSYNSEGDFAESVKLLETMINDIRLNGFDRIHSEIEEKTNIKKEYQNNILTLENTLKLIRNASKMNITEYKNLIREIDIMTLIGDRATRELYFINKEIPELKQDIEIMNDQISLKNEELRYIKSDSLEIQKIIKTLNYDIKKLNKSNTDIKKEKENCRNGIALLKKHIVILKDKIKRQEEESKEFLNNVSLLVNQSHFK